MVSKEVALSSLSQEEYLEKTGVSSVLKEIVTVLLETRPANAVHFISDYLKSSSSASPGVLKSYKLIKTSRPEQKSFMDNLVAAFMNLDSKKNANVQGITGIEYMKLLKMVCLDFPSDVVDEVLIVLGKRDTDVVAFEEFVAGINAILMYEDFFAEAEDLFVYLDSEKTGQVDVKKLFMAINKLNENKSVAMPSEEELLSSFEKLNIEEKPMISFGEFCLSLFKLLI